MKITVVITTKNRTSLFHRAFDSVLKQSRQPDEIIVVSDSTEENYLLENNIVQQNAYIIRDRYTHNYAGSLNSAIHFKIDKDLFHYTDYDDEYIAFLDDDDLWYPEYLSKCETAGKDRDFVISGIRYIYEEGERFLSIPQMVNVDDFLKGNPHVQGSNTFIRLSTLLQAGLFDEMLPSTTDRDLFTRVLMLSPTYNIINEYLLDIDYSSNIDHLTFNYPIKQEGLRNFFFKYQGMMRDNIKTQFFDRTQRLYRCGYEELGRLKSKPEIKFNPSFSNNRYTGNLVIGFIASNHDLGLRLIRQLISINRLQTQIVVFINYVEDSSDYIEILDNSQYTYKVIRKEELDENHYRELVDFNQVKRMPVLGISLSRSILQKAMYLASSQDSVFWILDEDMELYELHENTHLSKHPIDIDRIIDTYIREYDAVVGNYSLDAPLPLFATLRSSMLDYVYSIKSPVYGHHPRFNDYYHDLSDDGNLCLETPYPLMNNGTTINDVFGGKAISRYLALNDNAIKLVKNRGGNTVVFNRELMLIPNWTISIGGMQGRRSDYFWALLARQKGYKIANVPFSTLHNREKNAFNYEVEEKKLLADLIGSSFTKAVNEVGLESTNKSFHSSYSTHFKQRLVKHIANYYRMIGLLQIVGSEAKKYANEFSISRLQAFIKNCDSYLDSHRTKAAVETLRKHLDIYHHYLNRETYETRIRFEFKIDNLQYLGAGKEGIVFCNQHQVFKCFYTKPQNIDFLKKISVRFEDCKHFYAIEIFDCADSCIIRYPFEKSQRYSGGYADQIAELIRFAKHNGFVIRNFTNDNIVVVDGVVKFIDYGHSFDPFNDAMYKQSIQRAFQIIRYPFLDEIEFKELVALSYSNKTGEIDSGVVLFNHMVEPRSKESLHDEAVIRIVKRIMPHRVLDFGSGKCKISNSLVESMSVSVFDIDQSILNQRADHQVSIVTSVNAIIENSFDLVLCNLVLCSVDKYDNLEIMEHLTKALQINGVAIFSVCNPFFVDVEQTEIRTICSHINYDQSCQYKKVIRSTRKERTEHHRPIEYYINLFQRFGFKVLTVHETEGVCYTSMLPVSEHLIFECQLISKNCALPDTSLLIKSNPMEHRSIYENIKHIVNQLEKGVRFAERIVVLDSCMRLERNRRYDQDDLQLTITEITKAKENGLIDRIVMPEHCEARNTYLKYFNSSCTDLYAFNGQALFSSLSGFESVMTDYVFQTDSDILYYNDTFGDEIRSYIHLMREGAITVSPSIAKEKAQPHVFDTRTEVRTCLLNLRKLNEILPLPNEIHEETFSLPWHRTLDKVLTSQQSIRRSSSRLYFIHPENNLKTIPNLVSYVRDSLENRPAIMHQMNEVNLQGPTDKWMRQSTAPMVLYIRGYNTTCSKIKRLFNSIRMQEYRDFEIVYIDDASNNQSGEYAKFVLANDPFFKPRSIFVGNEKRKHILSNLVFAMQNIITDKKTIVVHIDNDDFLLVQHALSRIKSEYDRNAQLTVGNCVRYNKPLKRYKVYSFENVWERGGDNVWLHPKTHLRSLFDFVNVEDDLKINGHFLDVNTDFAFMLPMIENSAKNVFIPEVLYYFEPSSENITQEKQYNRAHKDEIKELILLRAKERYEKSHCNHR